MEKGTVYTETTVYSPPEAYAAEAPYQLAIVEFAPDNRRTVRIIGDTVRIGDPVEFAEERQGVLFYRKH